MTHIDLLNVFYLFLTPLVVQKSLRDLIHLLLSELEVTI